MSPRLFAAISILPTFVAIGCSCNEQSFAPVEWQDIDSNYGKWLSMDVGPDGNPVIAYYDVTNTALGFATGEIRSSGEIRWRHEQVTGYPEEGGFDVLDAGKYASMKVAPDGTVWIAFQETSNLWVAHRVDKTWTSEVVDTTAGSGNWASLALDAEGEPVVAHQDANNGTLRIARRADGAWTSATVWEGEPFDGVDETGAPETRPANVGQFSRLVIHDGTEYLAFYDAAAQNLQLLSGTAGNYTNTVVHSVEAGDLGQWPSIWTDGTEMAIAFENRGAGELQLATRSSPSADFDVVTVDSGEFVGADTEVFKKGDGYGIVYFEGKNNDMKLASPDGTGWTISTLGGANGAIGFFNEVVQLGSESFAASYDYTNQRVYFVEVP